MPEAPAPEATTETPAADVEKQEAPADKTSTEHIQLPDDHPLVKALKAEREAARTSKAEAAQYAEKAKRLDEIEEANKTELEKALARAEAAEAKVQESETQKQIADWRDEVAEATGVPAAALRGATKEEFEAHAETLKSLIPPTPGAAPAGKQGLEQKGADGVTQLTREDLKGMTPEAIVEAEEKGQLRDIVAGKR